MQELTIMTKVQTNQYSVQQTLKKVLVIFRVIETYRKKKLLQHLGFFFNPGPCTLTQSFLNEQHSQSTHVVTVIVVEIV